MTKFKVTRMTIESVRKVSGNCPPEILSFWYFHSRRERERQEINCDTKMTMARLWQQDITVSLWVWGGKKEDQENKSVNWTSYLPSSVVLRSRSRGIQHKSLYCHSSFCQLRVRSQFDLFVQYESSKYVVAHRGSLFCRLVISISNVALMIPQG
jgi:hypothetical protein